MRNTNEKSSFTEKFSAFVQTNRKTILIVLGVLVVILIGTIVFISVRDYLNNRAIASVEEINLKFEDLRYYLSDEYYQDDVNAVLAEAISFAEKNSGYAGSKAWSITAAIYSERKEWSKAEESWLNSARVGVNTYLGPIALFNAAVAAEEQGKLENAIELLKQCLVHNFEFPAAPRAQFNIGRIYEQLGNYTAALEAYRDVIINWSNLPVWHQLARSRMAAIEIR